MTTEATARPDNRTALALPNDLRGITDPNEVAAARFLVRYTEPTLAGYRLSLRQWFEFCDQLGVRPLEVQRSHVEVWLRSMESKGLMRRRSKARSTSSVAGGVGGRHRR